MKQVKQFILLVVAAVSLILTPCAANAFTLLQCDASGGVVAGTTLFDADKTQNTGKCEYNGLPVVEHIFSEIICDFVDILNRVLDSMYCGMHFYLINAVSLALTLYITLYGAQILMGTAQLSAKDSLVRMLKLAFIYVFSTQSAVGINFVFQFFMSFMADASNAVINTLAFAIPAQDDIVNGIHVCKTTNFGGGVLNGGDPMTVYNFLDYLVCHAFIGSGNKVSIKIMGFFMAMAIALPPMYLLFNWWFMTTFWTLLRTIVGFLKCLAAVAFLVTLSPIFFSFFLFEATTYLFENWLRYMISFSVQIVIIFGIIVLWILAMYNFVGFFQSLSNLIFLHVPPTVYEAIWSPQKVWSICPPVYKTDALGEPMAACPDHGTGGTLITLPFIGTVPICNPASSTSAFDATPPVCDDSGQNCQPAVNPFWQCDNQQLIPPSRVINQGHFLYFVVFHLITLLLITYAFSKLLERADDIARSLAGPSSVPSLLPGWGVNAVGNMNNFKGSSATSNLGADFHKLVGNR